MFGIEKVLNELTLISAVVTMLFAIFHKNGKIPLLTVILMCIITLFLYLSSRLVIKKNSKISEKDKEKLNNIKKEFNIDKKKGKKKNVKKDSSNCR